MLSYLFTQYVYPQSDLRNLLHRCQCLHSPLFILNAHNPVIHQVSRMMINIRSLPTSPLDHPTSTDAMYARTDLSFAAEYTSPGEYGSESAGIPDTAATAYFDHPAQVVQSGEYFGLPPGGYAIAEGAYGAYKSMPRPGSARTSGDATRVGEPSETGSIIEMGLMKVR